MPRPPYAIVLALGLTQIIGYGTLYYSFSILTADMARDLGWSVDQIFGLFSFALLVGGFASPLLGKAMDRFSATRMMVVGSAICALMLAFTALSANTALFIAGITATEIATGLVFYQAAFAALVEISPETARRSITYLTMIAGFASTLFWPITTGLHAFYDWRTIYLFFAALNLAVCLPLHFLIWRARNIVRDVAISDRTTEIVIGAVADGDRRQALVLSSAAFALQGYTLSAMLVHMVPLLTELGFGTMAVTVGALFGPSQVFSRFINMVFGKRMSALTLALIAGLFMAGGVVVLLLSHGWLFGAMLFAVCLGLGSGINSIAVGALPLWLFGSQGYGTITGKMTAVRLVASAIAPYVFSIMMHYLGSGTALGLTAMVGLVAAFAFIRLNTLAGVSRLNNAAV